MPTYSYIGLKKDGKKIKGITDADSKSALLKILQNNEIFVSEIEEVKPKQRKIVKFSIFTSLKKVIPDVFFQLSLLLKSGIPLVESLKITSENFGNLHMKKILIDLSSKIAEGKKLSQAMLEYESIFDPIHINLIKMSETTGRLDDILLGISEFEENKKSSVDKLKSALMYPLIVLLLGIIIVGFLLAYVVPKMEKIFSSAHKELPSMTLFLLKTGNFFSKYGIYLFVLAIILFIFLKYLFNKNEKFRISIDKKIFGINLIRQANLSKFAHVLAFQLKEGIALTDALKMSAKTLNNKYFFNIINEIVIDVENGMKFSESAKKIGVFPELFTAALVTGEKSGNLDNVLFKVSDFYSKNIERFNASFITLIEPIFIVCIGVVVLVIVLAIMGPLFDLNTIVK
jgi:type II secretory pathway component PulF